MKVLVVVAPENYRDEELTEPLAACDRAGIGYDIASTRKGECRGMLGGKVQATLALADVDPSLYQGIVIVGGSGSPVYLWNDEMLRQLVLSFSRQGKVVAAICLSPVVLAHAGILKGKAATCYESPASTREMVKGGARSSRDPVVVDGSVITANGPAAARDFAAAVIKALQKL
ncbi:MAG: DJ-1/PfpI family protein [Methanolinea sp.]|nr:DJ-1/PfpI family protein [Methanolinea sp.]